MFQSSKDLIWSNEPFAEWNLLDSVMLKQSVLKVFMSFVVMQKKPLRVRIMSLIILLSVVIYISLNLLLQVEKCLVELM